MNRLSIGNIYLAEWSYSGENSRGKYEMLKVVNEKGRDEITIFVNNKPSGIARGDRFCLNKVTDVIRKKRKGSVWNYETKQKEEGWILDVEINADVTRVDNDLDGLDGSLPDEFAGADDLPWDEQLPL